jgi:uncharacterized protein DUF3631
MSANPTPAGYQPSRYEAEADSEPSPAPLPAEPIDGDEPDPAGLLDELAAFIRAYVVLRVDAVHYLALWIAHTYVTDAAETTLYPFVTGPARRIGKSRLREVLEYLVRRPLSAVSVSEAALFRVVADERPTLLFDEVEALFGPKAQRDPNRQMLVAILNAGWRRRGGDVFRCVGEGSKQQVVAFPVFGPKLLVGIDVGLPDTLADRVVRVEMERRTRAEQIERLRDRECELRAAPLRDRLQRFGIGAVDVLAAARPELPDELDDRKQDGWEPLLAIADHAGCEWPARARLAAVALSASDETEDASPAVQLLADLREAFAADDRLPTATVIDRLTTDPESRWREYGRDRKPITARSLASLLRGFKIRSRTIRLADGTTPKGYLSEQFADAWNRYLATPGLTDSAAPTQTRSHAESDATANRHTLRDKTGLNPASEQGCGGVADPDAGGEGNGAEGDSSTADEQLDFGTATWAELENYAARGEKGAAG